VECNEKYLAATCLELLDDVNVRALILKNSRLMKSSFAKGENLLWYISGTTPQVSLTNHSSGKKEVWYLLLGDYGCGRDTPLPN